MNRYLALTLLIFVCACGQFAGEASYPEQLGPNRYGKEEDKKEGLFGSSGLSFGNVNEKEGSGLKINAFLWRASLDTISFMPLVSAEPFGGVIITDWYSPKGETNSRFKLNIVIMSSSLRADGIKVTAFKEIKKNGKWQNQQSDEAIATQIENAILTRARELKVSQ